MNNNTKQQIASVYKALVDLQTAIDEDADGAVPASVMAKISELQAILPATGTYDNRGNLLAKGMTVRYDGGWGKVDSVDHVEYTVNLTSIFGGKVTARGIPAGQVYEDLSGLLCRIRNSETEDAS